MSATSIFVSYATTDLDRSRAFYEALGYTINPMFSDENTICVVVSDTIYFMVMRREFFATFTDKTIPDAKTHGLSQSSLTLDSREAVDDIVARGLAAGGSEARPAQDLGFMYSRHRRPGWQRAVVSLHGTVRGCCGPGGLHGRAGRRTGRTRVERCRRLPLAARQPRGLGQYSGVARALERVGDRWALLIVRDLLAGARRYSDLKLGLPRIPTNILSDRLRELQEAGVLRRVPAVRGGYELTASGRALEAAVLALERWGWDSLGEPAEGEIVTADSLSFTLRAAFRPEVVRSMPPAEYRLHVVAHVDVPAPSAGGVPAADTTSVSVSAVIVDGVLELRAIGADAIAHRRRAHSPSPRRYSMSWCRRPGCTSFSPTTRVAGHAFIEATTPCSSGFTRRSICPDRAQRLDSTASTTALLVG